MDYVTSIGLDVHARSIYACAFDPMTGEVSRRRFGYEPEEVAGWILSFESPKAVYESGVTGFDLARRLAACGVDCAVAATSKIQRPPAQARRKNDSNDAEFLARLLSTRNVVEVAVPDEECEAARDLARAHDDVRVDLLRARQRLNTFLIRHGLAFDGRNADGSRKGLWTRAHWEWIRAVSFDDAADADALDHYVSEVRHMEDRRERMRGRLCALAAEERWSERVDALRCLRGVGTVTAVVLTVEAGEFSRFAKAPAYASWTGLTPSEHSSGERESRGGITKAGNPLCRRLLVEASWHYARAGASSPKAPPSPSVPREVVDRAAEATAHLAGRRRHLIEAGKSPSVATCATARVLACWVWAVGGMAEGGAV